MSFATSEERTLRAGIIQSNYIPWKGYFDFINSVGVFVILDDVQYTRRDWRNRNKVKTKEGLKWLTIPVETKGRYEQSIDETMVAGHDWIDEHLATFRHAYKRSPYFSETWQWLEPLYEACRSKNRLHDINVHFIREIAARLDITTPIHLSTDFELTDGKNERLIELCRQLGAREYLSGPAARDYIDTAKWGEQGISVFFKSYDGYQEYPQLHGDFEHAVTVLDLFFNVGNGAKSYFKSECAVDAGK